MHVTQSGLMGLKESIAEILQKNYIVLGIFCLLLEVFSLRCNGFDCEKVSEHISVQKDEMDFNHIIQITLLY